MSLIKKEYIKDAFKMSLAIIFPYIMVGFISGVFLESAGLKLYEIILMSLLVNTGSAQFIAASMISSQASYLSIILTTFVINFRHLLYSSGLSLKVETKHRGRLILMGQTLTDEVFAMNMELYDEGDWDDHKATAFGLFASSYWLTGNILGGLLGDLLQLPSEVASFTIIALFFILIILQIDNRKKLFVALATIPLALVIMTLYKGSFNIILVSSLGALLGYVLDRKEEGHEL